MYRMHDSVAAHCDFHEGARASPEKCGGGVVGGGTSRGCVRMKKWPTIPLEVAYNSPVNPAAAARSALWSRTHGEEKRGIGECIPVTRPRWKKKSEARPHS